MQNIQKYLYHGLNINNSLKILESIFSTGYLMTRHSLKQHLSEHEWQQFLKEHSTNWNETDSISLACHPCNNYLIEKYNIKISVEQSQNAYKQFIKDNISLVLAPNLLQFFSLKETKLKMGYEIQILGDIPVYYINAIAINFQNSYQTYSTRDIFYLKSIIQELREHNKGKNYHKYYDEIYYMIKDFHRYNLEQIYQNHCYLIHYLDQIRELLINYQLNIPIIDLQYGYELPNLETQKKRIKQLKKQYDAYLQTEILKK